MRIIIDTRILTILLAFSFFVSCRNKHPDIFLPDGTNLKGLTIKEIKNKYNLRFYQYEGFKGYTNDPLLNSFFILTKSNPTDVLTDKQITELEKEVIRGVVFEKIPADTISNEILREIEVAYSADSLAISATGELIIIREGMRLGTVKYVSYGVPGYMVRSP
jgi:hypothetical protein